MSSLKANKPVVKQESNIWPGQKPLPKGKNNVQDQNFEPMVTRFKRRAENSPTKNDKTKRFALGNLTNNANAALPIAKPGTKNVPSKVTEVQKKVSVQNEIAPPPPLQPITSRPCKVVTRASARMASAAAIVKEDSEMVSSEIEVETVTVNKKEQIEQIKPPTRRISDEFNNTEDSLYMTALDNVSTSDSLRYSGNLELKSKTKAKEQSKSSTTANTHEVVEEDRIRTPSPLRNPRPAVPEGIEDFDKANWDDPFQVSHYAMDIFDYLKSREADFLIQDYMPKQVHINPWMRSLLVDWMVEVQETYELNHETLYLAVKLVDIFLGKVVIQHYRLQLLGAAALFIASKYDDRPPLLIEDFLYICDGAYNEEELIVMERVTLKTVNYDLGIPLSYRFLRRYARCAKVPMPTLTLARYILELSLMDYATIRFSDSKLAAAALMMALRMSGELNPWTKTLEYYSGYCLEEFAHIIPILNDGLHRKPKGATKTIRTKYSHKIFHEVAKTPLLKIEDFFDNTEMNIKPGNEQPSKDSNGN